MLSSVLCFLLLKIIIIIKKKKKKKKKKICSPRIQEHSLLEITGHITNDGEVVFSAIAESGPIPKGTNAMKNGFRQMARERSPLINTRKPAEGKKPLKGLPQTGYQAPERQLGQNVARLF